MKLRYTPQAIADLRELQTYITDMLHNPAAAQRISKAILDACGSLKRFPELGVSIREKTGFETDLRMLVCKNQIALYHIDSDGDTISIARIINARQDYMRILFGNSEPAEDKSNTSK